MKRRPKPMQGARVFSLALLLCVAAPLASAETIILKNGRRIVASSITEEGDKIFYESGFGRIAIPKSMVDRIEAGGAPQPRPAPPVNEQAVRDLSGRIEAPRADTEAIVRGGAVDEERLRLLSTMASKGDLERQNAVNAHLIAAAIEARE